MIVRELLTRLGFDTKNATVAAKRFDGVIEGTKRKLANFSAVATAAATAAGFALFKMADSYQLLEGRLRLVTESQEELLSVQKQLFDIAIKTRSPIEAVTDQYIKLRQETERLGVSQGDTMKLVEAFQNSLILSGSKGAAAEAAIYQFGQGFTKLGGDEFKSLRENNREFLVAISEGLGLKGGLGELSKMSEDGLLDGKTIMRGVVGSGYYQKLADKAGAIPRTGGQAWTQVLSTIFDRIGKKASESKAIVQYVEVLDKLRGIIDSNSFLRACDLLVKAFIALLKVIVVSIDVITKFISYIDGLAEAMGGWSNVLRLLTIALSVLFIGKVAKILVSLGMFIRSIGALFALQYYGATIVVPLLAAALKKLPFYFLITGLTLLIDELWNWVKGNDSIIASLIGPWTNYKNQFVQLWDDMTAHVRNSLAYIEGAVNKINGIFGIGIQGAAAGNAAYASRPGVIGTPFDQNRGGASGGVNITQNLNISAPSGTEANMHKFANFIQEQVRTENARMFREVQANIARGY